MTPARGCRRLPINNSDEVKHEHLLLAGGSYGVRTGWPGATRANRVVNPRPLRIRVEPHGRRDRVPGSGAGDARSNRSIGRRKRRTVVAPLPPRDVENSLYAESADGLRVLSTRYRSRAVKDDTRQEVRAKEEQIKKLEADAQKIQSEIAVCEQDRQYLQKLEGFTAASLAELSKKGRLDSAAVLSLSKFIMDSRGGRSNAETELRQRQRANGEAVAFAKKQLAELSSGPGKIERDALIVVQKSHAAAGKVRLAYLVDTATWSPQYRLKGGAENAPVGLEYLAAVVQQSGEDWPDVRVTLSTARPSLDAAPPSCCR